jgi:hypothetical protein
MIGASCLEHLLLKKICDIKHTWPTKDYDHLTTFKENDQGTCLSAE